MDLNALLTKLMRPGRRRAVPTLDRTGPVMVYEHRAGAYRGLASVVYPSDPPLLTLDGGYRAGLRT